VHVSELYVYPIKSARGISLQTARLDERGFRYDRRWMLVDADGVFISQREAHRMALIDVALADDAVQVNAPDMPPLAIPFDATGPMTRARVWRDTVDTLPVSKQADDWFSTFLQQECRLLHMPNSARRVVDRAYVPNERLVGFADAFPLLIITDGSLALLNERLTARGEPTVPMRRFRPNIVIAGAAPHAEDEWKAVQIGDVVVDLVKPCARCVITTVDIESGEASKEPLRTLSTYRKVGSKVLFGQNAVHRGLGEIRIGDTVTDLRL
jgi:uncharacterized protein YcbX